MSRVRKSSGRVRIVYACFMATLAAAGAQGQQIAKLTADDAAALDDFGERVSISGDTAVVGATGDDDAGPSSGSAYIFHEVGGGWQQVAKLTASDAATGDQFGRSVSISGDTAVVGATHNDDAGTSSGSAYIFREVGGVWQQIAKLSADDAAAGDYFGETVSISGDAAVVGAPRDDDAGPSSGSAYIFREVGGVWQQVAKLTASDANGTHEFGFSVSISGDTTVVGAHYDDDVAPNGGSAYVFREVGGGWPQIAKLTASDPANSDVFGESVSLSGDTAVVGARGDDDAGSVSGSAYIFREVGGVWQQIAKLTADDGEAFDAFGNSVSITGYTAVIGAFNSNNAGSAYIFREVGGVWQQIAKLTADDAATDDDFGVSVSISGDTAIVGAYHHNDAGADSGSAYVFALEPSCPADINGDGQLDFFDVQLFLALYSAGDPAADFNGDGQIDFFDNQAFLAAYSAGCP